MTHLEPGIAFVRKPGGLVRGTFDGKYVVHRVNDDASDEAITNLLRSLFARGYGKHIPADGFPAELVETRAA